ncbi:MAG: N-acetyltransferase [Gallionellaceae bacterium CG_4_9_14_0_8_um_filter_60_335]|nr:N-acetyltransferase [Rhodoferax sp.]PIR09889.1 MAG: N-acetyltransferase [Gallionellaceae bacterium CG11_big_fil_rev_8_21_14_0_20_60_62]PJC05130.1 MAG: N-acetyltransferase [Gallionellaceae bacterium CG_4_9_14_0_8_um_filter_60_335]
MANPTQNGGAPLCITPVAEKSELDQFIRVQNLILGSDPAWIPPLLVERRMHLSAKNNPYFQHARWQAWIAWRGDRPVGRISAQIDTLHLERYGDATGFFGMLDAEDSAETFAALISTAEQWLRKQGMRRVRGPFSLSINEETGLLIDGFDTPPVFMMGHARPYYAERIEQCGYAKAQDMLAYMIAPDFEAPRIMQRLVAASAQRVRVRPLDRRHFDAEIALLRDIFNDAWAENWGFVPFTEAEFHELGQTLRFLLPENLIQIAEVDGEAAAFVVGLPNINEAIRDLGGQLFPFGWLKMLWRLKVRFPGSARVPLLGVRQKFQHTRLGPGLAFQVINAVRKELQRHGARQIELSWILEDNAGMRNIIESIGGRAYKRYRVYERQLDAR